MTIEKAIETLKLSLEGSIEVDEIDLENAKQLGIEALKFCEKYNRMIMQPSHTLLPGETPAQ